MRQSAPSLPSLWVATILLVFAPASSSGQTIESVGSRALGMGGAFVAVANDSSAPWWNPAGLAAGPFFDLALARTAGAAENRLPAHRNGVRSFSIGTPVLGIGYYRLRVTEIRHVDPTAQDRAGREEGRAAVAIRSLSASQFGATILHTVVTGVHAGATVKYVRGTERGELVTDIEAALLRIPQLLDRGEDLGGGEARGGIDLDIGILALAGPFRLGGVVRNLRGQEFDDLRLPRQVRVGAAYDAEAVGGPPVIVSLDADVRAYASGVRERRSIALGAEHRVLGRRLAIRGGGRLNTTGAEDGAVTAGATVSPRAGVYVDGHASWGTGGGEDGWGLALRVSF